MNNHIFRSRWLVRQVSRDYPLCRTAAHAFHNDERASDGILFECFNDIDANNLRTIMKEDFPEVPVYYTFLFDTKTFVFSSEELRNQPTNEAIYEH